MRLAVDTRKLEVVQWFSKNCNSGDTTTNAMDHAAIHNLGWSSGCMETDRKDARHKQ